MELSQDTEDSQSTQVDPDSRAKTHFASIQPDKLDTLLQEMKEYIKIISNRAIEGSRAKIQADRLQIADASRSINQKRETLEKLNFKISEIKKFKKKLRNVKEQITNVTFDMDKAEEETENESFVSSLKRFSNFEKNIGISLKFSGSDILTFVTPAIKLEMKYESGFFRVLKYCPETMNITDQDYSIEELRQIMKKSLKK